MEEDRHLMALGLRSVCLLAMPILRVVCASLDHVWLTGAVIAANSHTERGWVEALGPPRLALGCAATGLT